MSQGACPTRWPPRPNTMFSMDGMAPIDRPTPSPSWYKPSPPGPNRWSGKAPGYGPCWMGPWKSPGSPPWYRVGAYGSHCGSKVGSQMSLLWSTMIDLSSTSSPPGPLLMLISAVAGSLVSTPATAGPLDSWRGRFVGVSGTGSAMDRAKRPDSKRRPEFTGANMVPLIERIKSPTKY